jgi:hypothetical protein
MRPRWTVLTGLAGLALAVLVYKELPAIRRYLKIARM